MLHVDDMLASLSATEVVGWLAFYVERAKRQKDAANANAK